MSISSRDKEIEKLKGELQVAKQHMRELELKVQQPSGDSADHGSGRGSGVRNLHERNKEQAHLIAGLKARIKELEATQEVFPLNN